ncbi:MAG: ferritin-like domain-containing protein [Zoogloea sp.]|nr:ferritin-like domain-containing protein [Zoogloea sp.]
MDKTTTLGHNRTGALMSRLAVNSMQSYAEQNSPVPLENMLSDPGISSVRFTYAHEAESIGSVPMPGTLTGALSTGVAKLTGRHPEVLLDKLGERMAFERTGVRLYQALIDKAGAQDASQKLPFSLGELEHIRDEELEHMRIIGAALESIGADPTAQTPSADVAGVASSGVLQVLTDPRTSIAQALTAVLTAELIDNASWELLIRLSAGSGQDKLVPRFQHALDNEVRHAQQVRDWLTSMVLQEAS